MDTPLPRRIPVLTYHGIGDDDPVLALPRDRFRAHLELLEAQGLTGIGLGEAWRHHGAHGAFPADAVVLTFDDGLRDVHRLALPELEARGFGATVFLVSGMVGRNPTDVQRRSPALTRPLMGWSEVAECRDGGMEIGAHGLDHPDFTRLDGDTLERQLAAPREEMEQRLGCAVEALAYPFGAWNERVRNAAARHYALGCTTRLGRWSTTDDPMTIDRIDVYYLRDTNRFRKLLGGGLDTWLRARQTLRDLKRRVRRDEPAGYQYG